MTCHSEGSIDVFIEPIIPLKHIVVVGKTEIAKAIVRISKAAGYRGDRSRHRCQTIHV